MIKTGRNFTPGLIDSIPIQTRDKQTGKMYVRVGSCNAELLCEIAGNVGAVFEEELVDGDIVVNIGSGRHVFYIDVNLSAKNSKVATPKDPKEFAIKKLVWVNYPFPRPAEVMFTAEGYQKHKDTFYFDEGMCVIVGRTEDWYGLKDDDVVMDITKQSTSNALAYDVLHDHHRRVNVKQIWEDSKMGAAMDARECILDEGFYARPVQTIISKMPDYHKGKPDIENMVFLRWRAAIGIDKVEGPRQPVHPNKFFYFAMLAGLYGSHINALPKYMGGGPQKVVLFDHWLPLFNAMVDEWREDPYIDHTLQSFYRYVNHSPFNIKHLMSITHGLRMAGIIEDESMAITSLRNELYRQWKEEMSGNIKPSQVDYKIAVKEVLFTLARFKAV